MMPAPLLIALFVLLFAFFLVAGYVLAVRLGKTDSNDENVKQRMMHVVEDMRPDTGISLLRQKYLSSLSPFEKALESLPGMLKLEQLIEQSGRFFPAYRLVLVGLGLGAIAGAAAWTGFHEPLLALAAMVLAYRLPITLLNHSRSKRLAQFEEQLPDALDMMIRAMRAGHRFNDTLQLVAKELPDPISSEFGITYDELNYGVDMRIAFKNLLLRVPSLSLMAMATSVLVQRESGGNLAETLKNISSLVRSRFKFDRKVKTLTAEGRLSAWFLALLPVILMGVFEITDPSYLDDLFTQPLGRKILGAGLFLMALGALWINKLLKIVI